MAARGDQTFYGGGGRASQPGTSSGSAGPAGPAAELSSAHAASLAALQRLQTLPGWQRLLDVIDEEAKVSMRQVLSHHTSQPCQPHKSAGIVTSLRDSGLEQNVGLPGGLKKVRLELPALFQQGVGPKWVYETSEHQSMKKAQHDACKTTLAFLLAVNPDAVHLALARCSTVLPPLRGSGKRPATWVTGTWQHSGRKGGSNKPARGPCRRNRWWLRSLMEPRSGRWLLLTRGTQLML